TPRALEAIAELVSRLAQRGLVGAGTVRNASDAESAISAGAEFLVSPDFNEKVLDKARSSRIPYIPGALTPSEVGAILDAGVKTLLETAVTARQVRLFIGGQWRDASEGKTFEQVSPATGQVIGVVSDGTRDDARAAVDAAGRARHFSARLSILERAALCYRIADTILGRQTQLAPELSLEQGKPLHEASDEINFAAQLFRDAADYISRL